MRDVEEICIRVRQAHVMDADDIYSGLDVTSTAELEQMLSEARQELASVKRSLKQATSEKAALKEANDILARNISVLYNTAKAEIDRKNRQIEQLERELTTTQRQR